MRSRVLSPLPTAVPATSGARRPLETETSPAASVGVGAPWTHRPALDGLRTVAVYLVVLFHCGVVARRRLHRASTCSSCSPASWCRRSCSTSSRRRGTPRPRSLLRPARPPPAPGRGRASSWRPARSSCCCPRRRRGPRSATPSRRCCTSPTGTSCAEANDYFGATTSTRARSCTSGRCRSRSSSTSSSRCSCCCSSARRWRAAGVGRWGRLLAGLVRRRPALLGRRRRQPRLLRHRRPRLPAARRRPGSHRLAQVPGRRMPRAPTTRFRGVRAARGAGSVFLAVLLLTASSLAPLSVSWRGLIAAGASVGLILAVMGRA